MTPIGQAIVTAGGHPPGITAAITLGMIPGMIHGTMAAIGVGIRLTTTLHGILPCVITMVTGADGTDPATSTLHMPVHDGAVQVSLITGTPQRHTIVMQAMCVTMVRVTPVTTIPIRRRVLIRLLTIPVLTVEATVAEALAEAVAEAALLAVATLTVEGDKTG